MVSPTLNLNITEFCPLGDSNRTFEKLQRARAQLTSHRALRVKLKSLLAVNYAAQKQLSSKLDIITLNLSKAKSLTEQLALTSSSVEVKCNLSEIDGVIQRQEEELEQCQSQIAELEARVARREARAAKYLLRDLLREPVIRDLNADKAEPVELPRHCGYDAW